MEQQPSSDQQETRQPLSLKQARLEIGYRRELIGKKGGNDSEIPTVDRISAAMERGEIDPQRAVAMVSAINEGKQDYH